MRKLISLVCCIAMAAVMTGCAARAEQHTGQAQGYGGVLRVSVTSEGDDIISVSVTSHSETQGVGTRAIDALPTLIAETDSLDIDDVSGATVTSQAIKMAVRNAMGMPAEETTQPMNSAAPIANAVYEGVGMAATGRKGPGTDDDGNPMHSFNVVFAHGSFDEKGRILSMKVDQLEVLSSQFSGFPQGTNSTDDFMSEVSAWTTKRAKGDAYMLDSGSWRNQMEAYERHMTGMTMEEVNAWFKRSFDHETGKPMAGKNDASESDAISGATMSLRDEHGDILLAIQRAWEDAQRGMNGESEATTTDAPMTTDGTMVDTNTVTDAMDGGESMG